MNEFLRYEKQLLFKPLGLSGQRKLSKSRVGILGAGALGTNLANIICRSGIGHIVIADRDRIELSNLQRQMLFTEKDIGKPKALTVAMHLSEINSDIRIEGFFQTVDERNFSAIFSGCDLLLDATDNFASRFMINDACIKNGMPWIHSGVTAASGQSLLIVPGKTACLACVLGDEPPDGSFPTVHNSGILTSIVTIIASISAATAIRFLVEKHIDPFMKVYDTWQHQFVKTAVAKSESCRHCRQLKLRRK